ncbi:chemotaxis protein CheW [Noviherbaspirillum autotrophicum]|uniref:Chemotaxis protein CheW n=1 Tax=Noviherbaspirillum autotrophicum TaxID=709839 RepID=A0A0C2BG23_9BURK|nr:chemotaxis protein CheW [Noviherbaspirillum autotrophicum]KIF80195.1 chemotaxis protein CheW [Noviherbaspirillum autotrophicum]
MQASNISGLSAPAGTRQAQETGAPEFLIFGLGGEEYGIGIRNVQELRGYETVTRIANAPDYIKGVINLRGAIVPILDMRIKFGLDAPTYDALTVVVILNLDGRLVGIVVDRVSDVVTLKPEQIRPAPPMHGEALDTGYLLALGTLDDRMLILVDIDKLSPHADLDVMQKIAA